MKPIPDWVIVIVVCTFLAAIVYALNEGFFSTRRLGASCLAFGEAKAYFSRRRDHWMQWAKESLEEQAAPRVNPLPPCLICKGDWNRCNCGLGGVHAKLQRDLASDREVSEMLDKVDGASTRPGESAGRSL